MLEKIFNYVTVVVLSLGLLHALIIFCSRTYESPFKITLIPVDFQLFPAIILGLKKSA
jgi:hypothetical protein